MSSSFSLISKSFFGQQNLDSKSRSELRKLLRDQHSRIYKILPYCSHAKVRRICCNLLFFLSKEVPKMSEFNRQFIDELYDMYRKAAINMFHRITRVQPTRSEYCY